MNPLNRMTSRLIKSLLLLLRQIICDTQYKIWRRILAIGCGVGLICFPLHGQNFVKVSTGFTFADSTDFIQAFNFDFNRTEKVDEKVAKSLYRSASGFFITPSADVNLGETVSSSENNVLAQMVFGNAKFGSPKKDFPRLSAFNRTIEASPSYMADKLFDEEILYVQGKYGLNWLRAKYRSDSVTLKKDFSIAAGPLLNLGYRSSKKFDDEKAYIVLGIFTECKFRFLKVFDKTKPAEENWVFSLTANGFRILNELDELYSDDYAGQFVASMDKRILPKVFATISYKLGNNNPNYKEVNVGELGVKVKY